MEKYRIAVGFTVSANNRQEAIDILERYLPNYNVGIVDDEEYPLEPYVFLENDDNEYTYKRDGLWELYTQLNNVGD